MKVSFKSSIFLFLFFSFFACTVSPHEISKYGSSIGLNNPYKPNDSYKDSSEPEDLYFGPENPTSVGERTLDFPYELIPDTLTALTCPNTVQIAGQPLTLNLGAYVSHGLQLSHNFKKNNNIERNTDPQKVRQLIDDSPFKKAWARLALQDESNLRRFLTRKNNQGIIQTIQSFFPPLHNPSTLDHLSRLIPVFTTRSSSSSSVGRGGRFEALLPITVQELNYYVEGLAPANPGKHMLTLTYTKDGESSILSDTGLPYGRGYKIRFADSYIANYLIDVQEDRLETTKKDGEWNCPPHLVFPVHRAERKEDSPFNIQYPQYRQRAPNVLPEAYCSTGSAPSLNRSHKKFFEDVFGTSDVSGLPFKIGQTVLFDSDGRSFSTNEICVKFKKHDCYPQVDPQDTSRGLYYRIEFDTQKDCIPYGNHTHTDRYRICPAFLSVCYRYDE